MSMNKRTETGQVLVLLTVGIITLLGFTALAIDGGRLYSERRTVQGVSDTASLTGALYIAQQLEEGVDASDLLNAEAAAYQRAANNGYDSTVTDVNIWNDTSFYYVQTTIHTSIPPTIVQLVYDGPLNVAATSQARVPINNVFGLGQALVSLGKGDCPHPGINFAGAADFIVHNTGIYSNSNCDPSIDFDGGADADIDGFISAVGTVTDAGDVESLGIVSATPVDFKLTTEPYCDDLPSLTATGNSLAPGRYPNGITVNGNASVTLAPGLYCLGNDLRVTNGVLTGEGVTIYMVNGGVTINGGDHVLTAPSGDQWQDGAEKYWNGMLFFFANSNNSDLSIAGNAASTFTGTIYNYNGDCSLSGTESAVAFHTQVVCDQVSVSGTGYLDITYNPDEQFLPPTTIDLVE